MITILVQFLFIQCHCILCCDCPSGCASCLNQKIRYCPLEDGLIKPRFIRNTNGSPVYEQIGGSCYAYAACSAYINTILRIYGSKPPPSFDKCIDIADYNHGGGGIPGKSLRLLEKNFQYGIKSMITISRPAIRDVMSLSIILAFCTSDEGWKNVANGSLLVKPPGKVNGCHASLIEGYDFEKNVYIVKNSWGGKIAKPRFDVDIKATHFHFFYKVYFTLSSISNKTTKKFEPKIEKSNQTLYNKTVKAAWMDKTTAIYSNNYVCECHPERKDNLNYLGFDIDDYIDLASKKWGIRNNEFDLYDLIGYIIRLICIYIVYKVLKIIWAFLKFIYETSDKESNCSILIFLILYLGFKYS